MVRGQTRECPSCLAATDEATCPKCKVPTLVKGGDRDPYVGTLFADKFRIEKRIGRGAMSTVYRAHQLAMDRPVALKILKGAPGGDDFGVRRFYRELRATARVEHPNTIRVYDFGHTDRGELYLAVELLQGKSLFDELTAKGPFEPGRVVRIGVQVAKALGAAHQAGVVHRDLKPENLFLVDVFGEPDFVKVLDFGIARVHEPAQESEAARTTFGAVVGTPLYMSPEHVNGGVDSRSDLYSLGVVLFTMTVGYEPFRDKDPMKILVRHLTEEPPVPSAVSRRPVPAALDALILRLLKKDPAQRFQTADEVIAALQAVAGAGRAPQGALLVDTSPDVGPAPVEEAADDLVKTVTVPAPAGATQRPSQKRATGEAPVITAKGVLPRIAVPDAADDRTRPLPIAWDTSVEPASADADHGRTQVIATHVEEGPSLRHRSTAQLRHPAPPKPPWRWIAVGVGAAVAVVAIALASKAGSEEPPPLPVVEPASEPGAEAGAAPAGVQVGGAHEEPAPAAGRPGTAADGHAAADAGAGVGAAAEGTRAQGPGDATEPRTPTAAQPEAGAPAQQATATEEPGRAEGVASGAAGAGEQAAPREASPDAPGTPPLPDVAGQPEAPAQAGAHVTPDVVQAEAPAGTAAAEPEAPTVAQAEAPEEGERGTPAAAQAGGPDEAPPAEPAHPADPEPATARVTLSSAPAGASAWHGETLLGSTPLAVELPVGQAVEVELRKPGRQSRTVRFTPGDDTRMFAKLPKARSSAPRQKKGTPAQHEPPTGAPVVIEKWD